MSRLAVILSVLVFGQIFYGCGAGWQVTQYPQSPNAIVASGNGQSKMLQNAIDEATLVARRNILAQLEARLKGYQDRFVKESGIPADAEIMRVFADGIKQVVSGVLEDSRVISEKTRERDGLYEAKVFVQYPMGQANQALMDRIRREEELRLKFEQTKLFEQMEKEVKEFEEWKKQMNQTR